MKNRIKLAAYTVLIAVIIIMSVLIIGLINDKSDAVIQGKAQELLEQLDSSSTDSTESMSEADTGQESHITNLETAIESISDVPTDDSIAEFYRNRDRGTDYAHEREKMLIENSIFENTELEKYKYALTDQIEGFVKNIYMEHGDPVSALYTQRNGYDSAVVMMEDGFELRLRVITVREGVFDFEEEFLEEK